MATQKGKMFSGIIGHVIFKIVKGKQRVTPRPAPGTVRLTEASLKAASTFGMASMLGSKIRLSLSSMLKDRVDYDVTGRVAGALNLILQQARDEDTLKFSFESSSFNSLLGLNFNMQAPINKWLLMSPALTFNEGQLQVSFPQSKTAAALRFPKNATACRLMVAVVYFQLVDGLRCMHPSRQYMMIDQQEENLEINDFNFALPAGCLCIVTTSLIYLSSLKKSAKRLTNLEFNPSSISAAVITSGQFKRSEEFDWICMDELYFN